MKRTIVFLLAALLAACGPIYETRYDFIPPNSSQGMMCVQNCSLYETGLS